MTDISRLLHAPTEATSHAQGVQSTAAHSSSHWRRVRLPMVDGMAPLMQFHSHGSWPSPWPDTSMLLRGGEAVITPAHSAVYNLAGNNALKVQDVRQSRQRADACRDGAVQPIGVQLETNAAPAPHTCNARANDMHEGTPAAAHTRCSCSIRRFRHTTARSSGCHTGHCPWSSCTTRCLRPSQRCPASQGRAPRAQPAGQGQSMPLPRRRWRRPHPQGLHALSSTRRQLQRTASEALRRIDHTRKSTCAQHRAAVCLTFDPRGSIVRDHAA